MTIGKERIIIWLRTAEEEILRLHNCKDYINKIYYNGDKIPYYLHELLLEMDNTQIEKLKTIIEFMNIMLDNIDGKRMDALLDFRNFNKNPIEGLSTDVSLQIKNILMTPSTELNSEE
jgi:hypothetical protein